MHLSPWWLRLLSVLKGGGSVVVDLLLNVLPIVCGGSVFVFVLLCIILCPFKFCNYLEEEEKADRFAIIVLHNVLLLMMCGSYSRRRGLVCSV